MQLYTTYDKCRGPVGNDVEPNAVSLQIEPYLAVCQLRLQSSAVWRYYLINTLVCVKQRISALRQIQTQNVPWAYDQV